MFGKHQQILNKTFKDISQKYRFFRNFLDIGCGGGDKTLLFNEYNRTIWGVDCFDWRNEKAKKVIQFTKSEIGEFESLGGYDFIFSFDVIEHMPHPWQLISVAKKHLVKDGIFIVGTPNRVRLGTFGLRKFPYNPDNHTDKYAAHLREYSVRQLRKQVEEGGFKVVKTHKLFYGITGWFGFDYLFGLPLFHHIIMECVHAD